MDGFLRQSTASQSRAIGPFISDSDFKTESTSLTIANTDVKLRANGTTLTNKNSGGCTHQVNGMYSLTWDATDTANVGTLRYSVKMSGALQVWGVYTVLEEAVYDALFATSAAGFGVAQTGDSFTRLGAPAGASHAADVAAVFARQGAPAGASQSADVAAIQTKLGSPAGASMSADIAAIKADTAGISGISGAGPETVGFGDVGDFNLGSLIDVKFVTKVGSTLTALAGTPSLAVYRDNSTTEVTTGITLTTNFDSVTGLNHVRIDTTSLVAGSSYQVKIQAGTVSAVSVVGRVLGSFSIQNRSALRPTDPGRTLDVSDTGQAGIDWANISSPNTVVNLSNTTIKAAGDITTSLDDIRAALPAALVDGRIDANLSVPVIQSIFDTFTFTLTTDGSIGKLMADSLSALQDTGAKLDNMIEPGTVGSNRYTSFALSQAPVAAGSVADAVLDAPIEPGASLRQSMRLANAANAGKVIVVGVPPTQVILRDLNDAKDRVVSDVDPSGNRTPTSRDVT